MEYKAKKVHFIGIGGIGMSALAQLFLDHGAHVTGSDRDASPVTELLEKKGIKVIIVKKAIAVAGTHGKTTTTGMLAKILKDAGASPTAVVGSLVKDFDSNYLHGDSDLFVVEACEYKDHLLKLLPQVLVITNLE